MEGYKCFKETLPEPHPHHVRSTYSLIIVCAFLYSSVSQCVQSNGLSKRSRAFPFPTTNPCEARFSSYISNKMTSCKTLNAEAGKNPAVLSQTWEMSKNENNSTLLTKPIQFGSYFSYLKNVLTRWYCQINKYF